MRLHKKTFVRMLSGIIGFGFIIMILPNHSVYNSYRKFIDIKEAPPETSTTEMNLTETEEAKLKNIVALDSVYSEFVTSSGNLSLIHGKEREIKALLTIGIPTVSRPSKTNTYLFQTLNSLIENTSDEDKREITVVVFVADFNTTWNLMTAESVYQTYKDLCDSGFIHVVQAKAGVYPKFSKLERTLNDPMPRVVWRSKQNLDFAFLMLYCKKLSVYYMQLEDDVISAKSFLNDIKRFIVQTTKPWICLEFSQLGFIGKLFRTKNVDKVANFLITFFEIQPCDLLLGRVRDILGQKKPFHSKLSLFQHIGKMSSLKNKLMPSIDITFKDFGSSVLDVMQVPRGDNPEAKIETNMKAEDGFPPAAPYTGANSSSLYFWTSNPASGKYYRIFYSDPLHISRIIVSTGDRKKKTDILRFGSLKISPIKNCASLKEVCKFVEGQADTLIQGVTLPDTIGCISIEISKRQKEWLVIDKISVFIDKKLKS